MPGFGDVLIVDVEVETDLVAALGISVSVGVRYCFETAAVVRGSVVVEEMVFDFSFDTAAIHQ